MSTTITAISQLLDALGRVPFIPQALTKGTLLVLTAVCLTRLLGRAPAAARHLVWSLSVAGLLLLPATRLIPWRLELSALATARDAFDMTPAATRPAAATKRPAASNQATAPTDVAAAAPIAQADPAARREAASPRLTSTELRAPGPQSRGWSDPATVLFAAWLAGTLWMVGRLVVGVANVRRIVRRAVPADGDAWQSLVSNARASLGVQPPARVVISTEAAMPFTYGLLRPVIVLPASADEWTTDRRRSVLLHELAHVRRRDLITNAIVQLACAVYWFHPLVRLAARRVRIEAERACDTLVVAAGMRASDYAGDLLEIARTMRSSATAAVALAMARRSDFEGRLLAILAPDSGRNVLTAARAVVIALSFAAPAVAIAAAVPARHPVPNAEYRPAHTGANTSAGSTSASAEPESVAPLASLAAEIAQDSQAPTKAQGRDTAVPALLSVVTDSSPAVRLAAVEALGNLADPRAVDALVQALRTDTDARVREAAAESLGEIDSPRAVPGLIAALGSERVTAVRAKIAWALGEIDDARAVDALSAAVRDGEAEVRRQVVWALGEIESPAGVPALLSVLRDSDVETRKQTVWALGEIKSVEAITGVSAATKDAEPEVRKQAVESLGQIGDKRALPALEAATRDAEVEVRRQAVEAIGQLEDLKSAPQALIAATRDDDRGVRRAAAEALGQVEDEAAVPALIPLTRDSNAEVKRAAVESLANIGGARAIEVMAALLKDDDPEIRKLAAEALGKNR
jgi:HEAT repeat protein/beta-lactamase regulating signal transducer with metallopeptidase domain